MNADYIGVAQRELGSRHNFEFVTGDLQTFTPPKANHYDIVMAIALLHHLDDQTAQRLISLACDALAPGGRLVTYDGVYIDDQGPIARWVLSNDRGRFVRTLEGYRALTSPLFATRSEEVMHDTLRFPYTTLVMILTKA